MMKIGLIYCSNREKNCTVINCLQKIRNRQGDLKNKERLHLVGVITCGGCPGKKISLRAKQMLEDSADKVVLASCITNSNCKLSGSSCPYWEKINSSLNNILKEDKIIKL